MGVTFLVCGDTGWQIWMRINTDISLLPCILHHLFAAITKREWVNTGSITVGSMLKT